MIGYRDLLLRLSIWFLLTADLSLANIVIGVGVALLLPKFGATILYGTRRRKRLAAHFMGDCGGCS